MTSSAFGHVGYTGTLWFPLVAGWVIVRFGYPAFAVLLFAVGLAELCVGLAHARTRERSPLIEAA